MRKFIIKSIKYTTSFMIALVFGFPIFKLIEMAIKSPNSAMVEVYFLLIGALGFVGYILIATINDKSS